MATIKSWEDCEREMAVLADLDLAARKIQQAADAQIKTVRDGLKADLDAIAKKAAPAEAKIEEFARANIRDLAPLKTWKCRFGRVSFRDVPRFKWPKTNDLLIQRLKEKCLTAYVKIEEVPDKAGIAAHYQDLDLAAIGVKRTVARDEFKLEIAVEK